MEIYLPSKSSDAMRENTRGDFKKTISMKQLIFLTCLIPYLCFGQITSTKSGDFNDPSVWSTGTVPGNIGDVQINSGHTVTVTVTDTICTFHIQATGILSISSGVILLVHNNGCSTTAPGISNANKFNNLGTIQGAGKLTIANSTLSNLFVVNNGTMSFHTLTVENNSTTSYDASFENYGSYSVILTNLHSGTGDDCYFYNYSIVNSTSFVLQQINTTFDSYVAVQNEGDFICNSIFLNNMHLTAGLSYFDNYGTATIENITTAESHAIIPYFKNQDNATLNFTGSSIPSTVRLDPARSGSTVCYCATSFQQTIAVPRYGTSGSTGYYENLIINNSFTTYPQITLPSNIHVNTNLTLSSGLVNLAGFTMLMGVLNSVANTITRNSGHLYNGTLTRFFATGSSTLVGNNNSLFPLGTSYYAAASTAYYRPLWFTASSIIGGTMSVSHTFTLPVSRTLSNFQDASWGGATIEAVSNSYWTITRTFTSTGTKVLRYGGQGYGTSITDMDATQSASALVGTYLAATNVNAPAEVNRELTLDTEFANLWYIGTKNLINTPLPIKLLTFSGIQVNNTIELSWLTASEINNDHFEVEKLKGDDFENIGKVEGAGNSNQKLSYQLVDIQPGDVNYYRLKQVDYDGKESFSEVIAVEYIENNGTIEIYDVLGRKIEDLSTYRGYYVENGIKKGKL